jgi:hypothetical protein
MFWLKILILVLSFNQLIISQVNAAIPVQKTVQEWSVEHSIKGIEYSEKRLEKTSRAHKRLKLSKKKQRPVWDFVWIYGLLGAAGLLPFGLILWGIGLGKALLGLWLSGLIIGIILLIAVLLLTLSFRRYRADTSLFFKRWFGRIAIGTVGAYSLVMFIVGLISGALSLWLSGLLLLLLATGGILLTIPKIRQKLKGKSK